MTIQLFTKVTFKHTALNYLVPYILSMLLVFFYVFLTGFYEPLHPDAYRDIFLNFTGVTLFVVMGFMLMDRKRGRKRRNAD